MSTLRLELDDDVIALLAASKVPVEEAARETIVMDPYRRGAISEGRAAELLRLERLRFIQRASDLMIPHFRLSPEEWESEIAESRRI